MESQDNSQITKLAHTFLSMLWTPFQTIEKNRITQTVGLPLGVLFLCLLPSLSGLVFLRSGDRGMMGMLFMFVFFVAFYFAITTILFFLGLILGGTGRYTQLLRGTMLSLVPLFIGIGIVSFVTQLSTTFALIIFWPTLALTLVNLWWMFKHYHEIRGWSLVLATLIGIVCIAVLCFVLAILFISTART